MCVCDDDLDRAGLPWTPQEDALLVEYLDKGLTLGDLAWVHQRSLGAILSRLKKRGLAEYDYAERAFYRVTRTLLYRLPERV